MTSEANGGTAETVTGSVSRRRKLGWLSACCAAALAGCGGGDGGTGSAGAPPIVSTPAPPPAPPPAPTPPPGPPPAPSPPPGPAGTVAAVVEGAPAGMQGGDRLRDLKITNRGVYLVVDKSDRATSDAVAKVHGDPSAPNGWSVVTPTNFADAAITDYAPANVSTEADRAVAFYWTSFDPLAEFPTKWGYSTTNTGGVSIQAEGRSSRLSIEGVMAGAQSGTVAPLPWIVVDTRDAPINRIYRAFQDDGSYTNSPDSLLDRFSTAATPDFVGFGGAVAHPVDPHLYIASASGILVYDRDRLLRTFSFPQVTGRSFSGDMIWYQNALYVLHAGTLYRSTSGGAFESLFVIPGVSGLADLPGRICIASGDVYTADGDVINLATRARRSFLSSGTLTQDQTQVAQSLVLGLSLGVFCSASSLGKPSIYTLSIDMKKVRRITPVN